MKLLGLTFKANWKMDAHVNAIVSKTSFRMAGLARIKDFVDNKTLRRLLDSLVMSIVRYALEFTGITRQNLKKLQQVQNRALRLATNSQKDEKISDMLKETRWTSVQNWMRLQQLQTIHLILKTKNCSLCSTMIEVAKEVDQNRYNLREKELKIAWQPEKARSGANSAFFRMVKLFNDCGLATIEIPAGKGARKSLFKRLIVTRYGLSHKP